MKVRITDIHHSDAYSYRKEEFIGKVFEVFEGFTSLITEDGWSNLKVYQEELPGQYNYFYKVKYDIVEDQPVEPASVEDIFSYSGIVKEVRIGDRLRCTETEETFIVASVDADNVVLINIHTGMRWRPHPTPAEDVVLTKDEVISIIGDSYFQFWEKVANAKRV